MNDIIRIFKELVNILRDGGPYAGWALFILLWYFERRENKKTQKESAKLALVQVENNVKTQTTLESLKEALSGVKNSLEEIITLLNRIYALKESLLQLSSKSGLKLLESEAETENED